jgi:hypothetical protein
VSDEKLVLHPLDLRAILQDPPALVDALRAEGFVGAGFSHVGDLHYRAGPRFGELVTFRAGAPPDLAPHHVSLLETSTQPVFLGAANAQPPHCAGCQTKLADWKTQLLAWQTAQRPFKWSCAKCGRSMEVQDLVWGHTGGIARYSVDVWGIGEGDAVPSAELMALLEAQTFVGWRYFYYRF